MTATRSRNVRPPACDLVVVRRMAYPCELLPAGQPAQIVLNRKPYVVTCRAADCYTFHAQAGRSHDVCGGTCDCEDFVYVREARGEVCKHVLAVERMQSDGAV